MEIKLVACICCAALSLTACIGSNENVSEQSDLSSEAIQSTLAETETPVYEFTESDKLVAKWFSEYITDPESFADITDYQYYARTLNLEKDYFLSSDLWQVYYNPEINLNRDIDCKDVYLIRIDPNKLMDIYSARMGMSVDELCKGLSVTKEQLYYNWGFMPSSIDYETKHNNGEVTYSEKESEIFGAFNGENRVNVMKTHLLEVSYDGDISYSSNVSDRLKIKRRDMLHAYSDDNYLYSSYSENEKSAQITVNGIGIRAVIPLTIPNAWNNAETDQAITPMINVSPNSTTAMLEKLMQIILEIIRMQRDSQRYNSREAAKSSKENAKQPKIKFGEMKKTEYKKMLNAGDKMHRIEVDKNQLEGLNKIAKEIGAKYWVMSTEGNTASVIVPEKFFVQMQGALEEATKLQLTKSPQSLAVHNGAEIISAEDIDMAKAVLSYHDIPAATFKTDGGYMNIVSSDFDGQYKAAMQEISRLKDELKNIDITVFEQTMPFEYINKLDTKIIEATQEMAQYIKLNVPDAELLRTESGEIAVKYPAASETQIQNCITNYSNDIAAAQDYQAVIIDNTININRDKLLISENTSEYFTRVPNTAGQDYIKIAKDDSTLTDGKTISAKIDYDKTYQIFDKDGNLKSELPGRDLAAKYNTKSRSANKKTDIRRYNNDSLDRIEVYNTKENKLVRIGIENADVVRKNLLDCGISPFAAEKLLADIDNSLSDDYKAVFKYNPPSIQNSFSEIKSDMLEQYKVAEKISSAQLVDGFNDTLGKKCCVFDKRTNEYVLVPAQENRLKTALAQMGYDVLQTNVIVSEAQKSYSPSGATLEREDIHAQSFETGNAEVSAYKFCNDEHGIILIKQEITDTDVSIKYADINKDTTRPEIEKALKSEFHMQDAASIAELLNCMEKEQLISKAVSTITKDGFEISQVSSDYLKISKDSSTLMLDKNKVDIKQLSNAFGITEKQAEKLSNSLSKSLKAADRKEKSQTLNDIKNAAKKAYEQLSDKKAQPSPEKKISAEFDRS